MAVYSTHVNGEDEPKSFTLPNFANLAVTYGTRSGDITLAPFNPAKGDVVPVSGNFPVTTLGPDELAALGFNMI